MRRIFVLLGVGAASLVLSVDLRLTADTPICVETELSQMVLPDEPVIDMSLASGSPSLETPLVAEEPTPMIFLTHLIDPIAAAAELDAIVALLSVEEPAEPTTPEPTVPESEVLDDQAPDSTTVDTAQPDSTVPETTVPETTVPETTVPQTTVPQVPNTANIAAPDPRCPPVVEILDAPGWGSPEEIVVANDSPLPNEPPLARKFSLMGAFGATSAEVSLQPAAIQPGNPRSTEVYTVSAQVSVEGSFTLAALKDVSMCWYKQDSLNVVDGVETGPARSDCSTLDPRVNFKMEWNEAAAAADAETATAGFSVVTASSGAFATNEYRNEGSRVEIVGAANAYNPTATEMAIKFSFKVSGAMAAGSDWAVAITATYDAPDSPSATQTRTDLSVGYWSTIVVTEPTVSFGPIAAGGSATQAGLSLGTYRANGATQVLLTGNNYSCSISGCSRPLVLRAPDTMNGEVTLECAPSGADLIQVTRSATGIEVLPGTGEQPESITGFSCTLSYTGGAERAMVEYTGSITLTIGAVSG